MGERSRKSNIFLNDGQVKTVRSCIWSNSDYGYSTFSSTIPPRAQSGYPDRCAVWYQSLHQNRFQKKIAAHPEQSLPISINAWKLVFGVTVVLALLVHQQGRSEDFRYATFTAATWQWDHNVYMPTHQNKAASLIVQIVPGKALNSLGDISMRPNRAYARQRGVDFARYDSGRPAYSPRSCFDKVAVLNEIIDGQTNETSDEDRRYLWPRNNAASYDVILILPTDAILLELDTNIIQELLPSGRLASVAGWSKGHTMNSNSDIVAFNLKHSRTEIVARRWLEMATSLEVTCGDNNDLAMLIAAIAESLEESEEIDDLIKPLPETSDGFLEKRMIKCIPAAVPGARSSFLFDNLKGSGFQLQETADSVCYRFYPKCEVLTKTPS